MPGQPPGAARQRRPVVSTTPGLDLVDGEAADEVVAPASTTEPRLTHRRRRRLVILLTVVLLVLASVLLLSRRGADEVQPQAAATAKATVERRDLVVTEELEGELGYADQRDVASARTGVVTAVAAAGTTISPGEELYQVDLEPTAVLKGEVPAYRALDTSTDGADVKQLERGLDSLGYGNLTVDRHFTSNTADAVEQWEADLGRSDPDGVVELGDVVFAPDGVRVSATEGYVGAQVQQGSALVTITSTSKVVSVDLDADRSSEFEVGTPVTVSLPNGAETTGTVANVGTEPQSDPSDTDAEPTVPMLITLSQPASAASFDSGAVDVTIETSREEDVLAVPVTALVALAEGGYAIEVVERGTSRLIAVEIGTVAEGWVAIEGDVVQGAEIVVPA